MNKKELEAFAREAAKSIKTEKYGNTGEYLYHRTCVLVKIKHVELLTLGLFQNILYQLFLKSYQ